MLDYMKEWISNWTGLHLLQHVSMCVCLYMRVTISVCRTDLSKLCIPEWNISIRPHPCMKVHCENVQPSRDVMDTLASLLYRLRWWRGRADQKSFTIIKSPHVPIFSPEFLQIIMTDWLTYCVSECGSVGGDGSRCYVVVIVVWSCSRHSCLLFYTCA